MATSKEFHDYIVECLSKAGNVTTRRMMGEYCVYFRGKLIGDICDNRFLVKRTAAAERLLAGCALEYPYEGSRTLMYVVEEPENSDRMRELLEGLYAELPDRKQRLSGNGALKAPSLKKEE